MKKFWADNQVTTGHIVPIGDSKSWCGPRNFHQLVDNKIGFSDEMMGNMGL